MRRALPVAALALFACEPLGPTPAGVISPAERTAMAETLGFQVMNELAAAVPREARTGIPGICPGCLGCTFRCERDLPGNCVGGSGRALVVTSGSVDGAGTGSADASLTAELVDCVGDGRVFSVSPPQTSLLQGALMLNGSFAAAAPVTFVRNTRRPILAATLEGVVRWVSGPSVTAGECRVALTVTRAADRRSTTVQGEICGDDVAHTFRAEYCCEL